MQQIKRILRIKRYNVRFRKIKRYSQHIQKIIDKIRDGNLHGINISKIKIPLKIVLKSQTNTSSNRIKYEKIKLMRTINSMINENDLTDCINKLTARVILSNNDVKKIVAVQHNSDNDINDIHINSVRINDIHKKQTIPLWVRPYLDTAKEDEEMLGCLLLQ